MIIKDIFNSVSSKNACIAVKMSTHSPHTHVLSFFNKRNDIAKKIMIVSP